MKNNYDLLIATDYSKCAAIAEEYAIQFAKKTNSSILFLHVFPPPLSIPLDSFNPEKIEYNPLVYETKRLKEHITNILKSLNINEKEISYNYLVREGNFENEVKQEAKESDVNFIFIGTHGASGLKEILFGSNAWKIIKNSKIPVFAIPSDALKFSKIKRIVFATEYREGEIPAINYLTRLAREFEAEVIVLHVSSHVLSQEHERNLYDNFRKEALAENQYKELDMHFIYNDNIIDGINNFCLRTKTNLLVISPEKLSFIEKIFNPSDNIAKKISYNTHIPLLSIPDYYNPEHAEFWKIVEMGDAYWDDDV